MNDRDNLLHHIGVIRFVLTDLILYLDTHPEDQNAWEYYNHYVAVGMDLKREFSRKYYPIQSEQSDGRSNGRWTDAPLPWEGGCQ